MNIVLSKKQLSNLLLETLEKDDFSRKDLEDIFITEFKKFLEEKYEGKLIKAPLSYFLEKHLKEFIKKYNLEIPQAYEDENDEDLAEYMDLSELGFELITKGVSVGSELYKGDFLLQKFGNKINKLLDMIPRPDYIKLSLTESAPYKLYLHTIFDFEDYLKSKSKVQYSTRIVEDIEKKFLEHLKMFLNIVKGSRSHGKFLFKSIAEPPQNYKRWTTTVLSKLISKTLRSKYRQVKSIALIFDHRDRPTLKVSYNESYFREKHEVGDTLRQLLTELDIDTDKFSYEVY